MVERVPTPPPDQQSKEKNDQVQTLPPAQPFEENSMAHPYPKYGDDPDAEAHVYAFLQTWEANHVSQQLMDVEAQCSKIAEFSMTLEGPDTRWYAKHLPGSFATFEALNQIPETIPPTSTIERTRQPILQDLSGGA